MTSRCKHVLVVLLMIAMATVLVSCGSSEEENGGGGAVATVSVTAGSSQIVADGVTSTTIRAVATDSDGNMVSDGTAATFTTSAGTITNVTTTHNGIATALLTSTTNLGTATVTVDMGGISDSTTVKFIAGPPATISVTASPANLTADGTSTSSIRIVVRDGKGNPVEDGETVTISSQYGTCCMLTTSTNDGVATVTYTAPETRPASGNDRITASTANGTTGGATILLAGPAIATVSLSANPQTLPANESSTSMITATVSLEGGGPAQGVDVTFTIIGDGLFTPSKTKIIVVQTNASGIAEATLQSGDAKGTATIEADADGVKDQIDVFYVPGSMTLSIIPNSMLGTGVERATVTATLEDVDGSFLSGKEVTFSLSDLSLGSLSEDNGTKDDGKVVTEADGTATVTFTGAARGGTVTVTAEWETVTGSKTITIQPPPSTIGMAEGSPDPASISVLGSGEQSTSSITFDVKDNEGNPVVDGYRIDFYLETGPSGGEYIAPLSARTENGQVSTILHSGFKSGPVSIKAVYYHDTSVNIITGQVAISSGPPAGEAFSVAANYWNVSGLWISNLEDVITAYLADAYGNSIPDDTSVSFKTYNTGGFFDPGDERTLDGRASSILVTTENPVPAEGFVSMTAEAVGGRTTRITSLEVAPLPNSNIVYAGTNGGGIYKSVDSGATWETVSRSTENARFGQNRLDPYVKGRNAISIDPDNPDVVYAATGYLGEGHVFRSRDGGMNWDSSDREEWNGLFSINSAVLSVLCDGVADTDPGTNYPYVWIGTEGRGVFYAKDGETFQTGGGVEPVLQTAESGDYYYDNSSDTGDGLMRVPILSYTTKTETWEVLYEVPDATATLPEAGDGNGGNATMTAVATDNAHTETETWTLLYRGTYENVTSPGGGKGTLENIVVRAAQTETWTLRCVDDSTAGTEIFSVAGGISGVQAENATVGTAYSCDAVSFIITRGAADFVAGDEFIFKTTMDWQVTGDVSGEQTPAVTGFLYTSDDSEVSFTINAGGTASAPGDTFTFSTVASSPYWTVTGSVSGLQSLKAYTGEWYYSDGYEVMFLITEGSTSFAEGDRFNFRTTESGLGYGMIVREIKRVSGTHGATAILYAGTNEGVYRSDNGGQTWEKPGSFVGNNINALALHPQNDGGGDDILYVGTEEAGVWMSLDSGVTWEALTSDGLGGGVSTTEPLAARSNHGNGVIQNLAVGSDTKSELWILTATDDTTFTVTGTVSGDMADATVDVSYTEGNVLAFTIAKGSIPFEAGDSFEFETIRDPGKKIRDLLVDIPNNRLYALTYFWGPLPHAVGNVYVIDLDETDSYRPPEDASWDVANKGLPQYDPPNDTSLYAQHALAMIGNAEALLIGGEGINCYKASGGLDTGDPSWKVSKQGLSNLIMARMPILFSGECNMYIEEDDTDAPIYRYKILIEDENGNPPVSGSLLEYTTFKINKSTGVYQETETVTVVEYPDSYTHRGTWPNPGDLSTFNPYEFTFRFAYGRLDKVTFTFTPTNLDEVPGSSGGIEEWSFEHFHDTDE